MTEPRPSLDENTAVRGASHVGASGRRPIVGSGVLDAHSITIEPLTREELCELRRVGREARSFDGMAREVLRLQFIAAVAPPLEDPDALAGLRRRERALLLQIFAAGTTGPDELRLAALLSRGAPDHDNLVAMLWAALEVDCMRQGLLAERGHAD